MLTFGGRRLGVIGIVEEDWLETLFGIPASSVAYESHREAACRLCKLLRAPPHRCDAVVALTHMRQPNDDSLAASCADLDAILAGHDHHYGVTQVGGTYIFKSGTDFENFTSIELMFGDEAEGASTAGSGSNSTSTMPAVPEGATVASSTPIGSSRPTWTAVRTRVASFERVDVLAEAFGDGDDKMAAALAPFEAQVESMLGAVLCQSAEALDCRRDCLRLKEAPLANLVADVMRAATCADVAMINSGTLRAERVLEAGPLSMRELFQVLPMMENVSVIAVSGSTILQALENSVSKVPKKDGRFAHFSGLTFVYDPARPAADRISPSAVLIGGRPLDITKEYTLCSKEFICVDGKDGYDCFVGKRIVVDAEAHPAIPTLLQRHLEAIGKRDEPLRCFAEGRIQTAAEAARASATPPTSAHAAKRQMRKISKDLLGHASTESIRRISKEAFTEPTITLVGSVDRKTAEQMDAVDFTPSTAKAVAWSGDAAETSQPEPLIPAAAQEKTEVVAFIGDFMP